MAVNKCLKCGAAIPEGAEFCPGCGAPKGAKAITQQGAQPVQPAQPTYQQPMQQTQPGMGATGNQGLEDMAKTIFSTKLIIIAVCIGVLLLIISTAIIQFSEPQMKWEDNHVTHFANVLRSMCYYGIGLMLICGGIVNRHLEKYFRLGLIIAGAIILG